MIEEQHHAALAALTSELNTKYDEVVKALDTARQTQADEARKAQELLDHEKKAHEEELAAVQAAKAAIQQDLQSKLDANIQQLEAAKDDSLKAQEVLKKDIEGLKKDLEAANQGRKNDKSALTAELNELQQHVDLLETSMATATTELENVRKANADFAESLTTEKAHVRRYREEMDRAKSIEVAYKEERVANGRLFAQVAEQKALVDSLQDKLAASRKKSNDDQTDMAEELQSMSKMFGEQIQSLDEEKKVVEGKLAELQHSLEERKLAERQAKSDLASTAEDKSTLEEKLKELQAKLEAKDKEVEGLTEEKNLQKKVHEAEITQKEVELKNLKEQLKEVSQSIRHVATITSAPSSFGNLYDGLLDGAQTLGGEDSVRGGGASGASGQVDEGSAEGDAGKDTNPVTGIVRHPPPCFVPRLSRERMKDENTQRSRNWGIYPFTASYNPFSSSLKTRFSVDS